ncbi:MAG: hypothetical protein LBS24_00140 [Clostridiales Family XIII bacterium]|jgi:hypothetical protein|nr:hypothetical protein [Clostridiales Family XIII bacterium]
MKTIKKIGVAAGAVVGGVIGGSVSMVGKLSGVKFIDELGESIVDSAIYTGSIAGDIVGGTTDLAVGRLTNDAARVRAGAHDLKSGGKRIVDNLADNVKTIAENGGDVVLGIKDMDGKRVLRGAKTLAKVVVVSAVTVGAIRVKKSDAVTQK